MRTLCLLLLCSIVLLKATAQPGHLDSSFGKNGIQTTGFLDTANILQEYGQVVLTNANGDIFVVAQVNVFFSYIRIVKYLPDGRLDSSYGNAGYSNAANLSVACATMQGDKIIVAGSALARFTANGRLDSSFGVNGIAPPDFNTCCGQDNNVIHAITLQGDKILVAGYDIFLDEMDFPHFLSALARYTANGTLDSSFLNGIISPDLEGIAGAITLQGDKILVGSGTLVRCNANGVLDSSFGVNGQVTIDFGANAIALQGDKIVVAGSGIARYTVDGVLDSSFGVNGQATIDFGANAISLQGDKIVVAGSSGSDFALARFTADGTLDSSFGVNGQVIGPEGQATSMALQGAKIIVAGYTVNYDYSLVRYTPDGSPDNSFGVNGELAGHFPTSQLGFLRIALQGDKIIAAGHANDFYNYDFALARFTKDGALDASFGKNGIVTTDFNNTWDQPYAVALQGDKILVAGLSEKFQEDSTSEFALARYTKDGTLDSSFGVNGRVTTNFNGNPSGASSIALQDDKIIVAGASGVYTNEDLALARYTADGSLDSSFGVNGKVTTDFNNTVYFSTSIALQGDKILVTGTAGDSVDNTADFALVRYAKDGILDASFGVNGIVKTDFDNNYDNAYAIALQGDKIVVAGRSISGSGVITSFALARYNANGTLDSTFGRKGQVTSYLGGSDGANSLVIQEDKIIVAGGGIDAFIIARYTTKGILDSSFGVNGLAANDFSGNTTGQYTFVQDIALHENRLYAVGEFDSSSFDHYGVVAAYQLEAVNPTEPSISIADVTVCESQKYAVLTVQLSAPSTQVVRVYYQTHFITAYTPQDYIGGGAILYIPAGTTAATIKIPIVNDSICEPTEQFEVLLRNACHATLQDSIAIVTIKDDDCNLITSHQSTAVQQEAQIAMQVSPSLGITASPNPSANAFTIQMQSNDLKQQLSIRVYDMVGKLVEQRMNISIGQILRLGDQYLPGTYIIEAVQGSKSVQTKVIKTGK